MMIDKLLQTAAVVRNIRYRNRISGWIDDLLAVSGMGFQAVVVGLGLGLGRLGSSKNIFVGCKMQEKGFQGEIDFELEVGNS